MKFEWDEHKRQTNIQKHGLDFKDAVDIFNHPMLRGLDNRFDYGEDRWIGIGLMYNHVAVVVYIEYGDDDTVRIISLRKALNYERKRYERYLTD